MHALHTPHDREEALPTSRCFSAAADHSHHHASKQTLVVALLLTRLARRCDISFPPSLLDSPHNLRTHFCLVCCLCRRDGEPNSGEESYPTSPLTGHSGSATPATREGAPTNGDRQRYAFAPAAAAQQEAAAARDSLEDGAPPGKQPVLTAPGSAQGFGSAHSSSARSVSVSDAEDVSLGASEDRGDLQEVSRLAGIAAAGAPAADVAAAGALLADGVADSATEQYRGGGDGEPSGSEDSLASEMAKARALAAGGAVNGTAAAGELPPAHAQPGAPAGVTRRVSASFAAAREVALAAAAAAEQHQQRASSKTVGCVSVAISCHTCSILNICLKCKALLLPPAAAGVTNVKSSLHSKLSMQRLMA